MNIRTTTEDPLQIHDELSFVTKTDVTDSENHVPAYEVEGPDGYVIGVEPNTPLGVEARDSSGNKLDGSTRVILQKADVQGNPLGNAIIFEHNLDAFDYEKMRSDPQYFKYTRKPLLLKEREYLYVYFDIPSGGNAFSASDSALTIGDNVTQTGKPVFIRELDSLSKQQQSALKQAQR